MGSAEFGRWVAEKMDNWTDPRTGKKGMKPGRLASRIGELSDGRVFDATGTKLIYSGRRRDYDTELVTRIAQALGEDPHEACHIAGVEQPGFNLEEYRRFRSTAEATSRGGTAHIVPCAPAGPDRRQRRQRRDRRQRQRQPWAPAEVVPLRPGRVLPDPHERKVAA